MNTGVDGISVVHGGRVLFSDISFQVSPGDRVGLIGKNGAGKSTLLKLLAGLIQPDEGTVSRSKGVTIAYLPQEMPLPEGRTIFQETSRAYQALLDMDAKATEINNEMARRTDYESASYLDLIHKLADINEEMNRSGWYEVSMKVEKVLLGLGFSESDFTKPTSEYSGGWRMRVELAKLLLLQPDLLLLDEPTNHLDIESIQWLEGFLASVASSIVLISHDITFLDKLTNRTIEITGGRIYDYPLPYSKYLLRREEVRATLLSSQKNQEKMIKETEVFISRFRAKNTKAKQVQSRIKKLEKIERIEIDEERISEMKIRFPEAPRSGKVTLEAINICKSYGEKVIFTDLSFIVGRGEKIAFVGRNGAGKTTLSKMIAGDERFTGNLKFGHEVKLGYYAQDQSQAFSYVSTVLQEVEKESGSMSQHQVRDLLGAFLFSGDDQSKKVQILSGGEKARLALCKLLLRPVNFLVLDEPTNHLDIHSKSILKRALNAFNGTIILVSHDREFLAGLTDRVFEFTRTGVRQFLGDVNDFLASRKAEHFHIPVPVKKAVNTKSVKAENVNDSAEAKRLQKEERRIRLKIEKTEAEITSLEQKLSEINKTLSESTAYQAEMVNEYHAVGKSLESSMKEWEKLSLELDAIAGERPGN